MTGEVKIDIGQTVILNDCEYEFVRLLPSSNQADIRRDLQFVEIRTGCITPLTHAEFDRRYDNGEITLPSGLDRPGDELPEDKENEIDGDMRTVRQTLLRAFDESPVAKTDKALNEFIVRAAKARGIQSEWLPKASTFRGWERTRGEKGKRARKHMGRRREPNGRKKGLDPIVEKIVTEASEAYFRKNGVSATDVYAMARHSVTKLNIERERAGHLPLRPASRTVVWRRIVENSRFENVVRRCGARKAKLMFKPHQSYAKPTEILELVIIDDTVVDCFVIDESETNEEGYPVVIGRPHLAIALDSFSRCVIGYVIGYADPSVETAMACLRNLVRPKRDLTDKYPGIRGSWVWGGLPQTVLYDRAWSYVGSSMLDALDDVGVSITSAPAGTPEYKGRGERFFGTLNSRLFCKLPGGVPYKPQKMKENDLNPITAARLTLDDLHKLIIQAIIDYNNADHSELNDIPARLWNSRAKKGIHYANDLLAFDMACAKLAPPRVLSSKGIELFGLHFCGPEVFDLLNDMVPVAAKRGHREGTVEVKVKYLPENISVVFIWNTVRNRYVKVHCTEKRYSEGLGEYQHSKIMEFCKERSLAWRNENEQCEARALFLKEATAKLGSRLIRNRKNAKKVLARSEQFVAENVLNSRFQSPAIEIPSDSTLNRKAGDQPPRAKTRKQRKNTCAAVDEIPIKNQAHSVQDSAANDAFSDCDRESLLDGFN
jgi:putative transposase